MDREGRWERQSRRAFLRTAIGGLSLPSLLAMRARASVTDREPTALLVVWLQGGASHLETYDPKPEAPDTIRGPYGAIETRAPGVVLSELLPRHAEVADKFAVLRSLSHSGFCHQQGNQQMFTGHPVQELKLKPDHPDLFCIANSMRSHPGRSLPAYVGVGPIPYLGASYLGDEHEVFAVHGDPNAPGFSVQGLTPAAGAEPDRLLARRRLAGRMDDLRRALDVRAQDEPFDAFHDQAYRLLTGPAAQAAFDLGREDPRIRDRYGRNTWGQRLLMGRRLVEAGVDLVAVTLDGPLCGRVGNWDDHAVNHHIFEAMKARCMPFDQAVSALIEDVHARGLDRRLMILVTGEFGRTPRISRSADSASGVEQPGRDHWPHAVSLLISGGGVRPGQVVGATDPHGAHVRSGRVGVRDLMATLYRHLGIDAASLVLQDRTGRPVPALPEGTPIDPLFS